MRKASQQKMARYTLYTGLILFSGGMLVCFLSKFTENSLVYVGLFVLFWAAYRFYKLKKTRPY